MHVLCHCGWYGTTSTAIGNRESFVELHIATALSAIDAVFFHLCLGFNETEELFTRTYAHTQCEQRFVYHEASCNNLSLRANIGVQGTQSQLLPYEHN